MSRSLIIAGLAASALHVVVLGSLEVRLASHGPEASHDQPIALTMTSIAPEPPPLVPDTGEADDSVIEPADLGESAEANKPPDAVSLAEERTSAADVTPEPATPAAALDSEPLQEAPTQPVAAPPVPLAASAEEAVEVVVAAAEAHVIESPPEFLLALLEQAAQRARSALPRRVAASAAPPPSPPAPRGVREEPTIEHRPKPRYPAIARRRGYEGEVLLLVHVQSDGRVGAVTITRSSGHDVLDRAAARTVREQWRFRAGSIDARPAAFWIEVPIEFRLTDSQ